MLIKGSSELDLYKTPLDSNYRNVYDSYSTINEYYIFLNTNFDTQVIMTSRDVSRADTNGNFKVVLSGYDSMEIHDYNYMSFESEEKRLFAFITSVSSRKDGSSTKECEITCRLDAWANNYNELKAMKEPQTVIRGTFDQAKNKLLYNSATKSEINTLPVLFRRMSSLQNKNNNGISVIWARILSSVDIKDIKYYNKITNTIIEDHNIYKPLSGMSMYPLAMYVPVGIYDNSINASYYDYIKCSPDNFVGSNEGDDNYFEYYFTVGSSGSTKNALSNLPYIINFGTYIQQNEIGFTKSHYIKRLEFNDVSLLECALTTWVPFNYKVDVVSNKGYYVQTDHRNTLVINFKDKFSAISCKYEQEGNSSGLSTSISKDLPYYPTNKDVPSISEAVKCEYFAKLYPFLYYSVLTSMGNYPILEDNNQIVLSILNRESISPSIMIEYKRTGNTIASKTITLNNSSVIPSSYSQYDLFLQNQGNRYYSSLVASMTSSAIKSIGSAASGNIFGAVGNYANFTAQLDYHYATIADYKNMLDVFNLGSESGTSSLSILDDAIILINSASLKDEDNFNNVVYFYHCNGVGIKYTDLLTNTYREYFDIKQISDVNISAEINEEDKRELESAFSKGVTMWHIKASNKSVLKTLDKSIPNLYNFLVPIGG